MNKLSLISFIVFLLILNACKDGGSAKSNKLSNLSITEIVSGIENENVLMGEAVGITGEKPEQWKRFEVLKSKASEKELIALTNHSNPTVRCYAFKALISRRSNKIAEIVAAHAKDTANVYSLFGCMGGAQKVCDVFVEERKASGMSN